MTIYAGRYQRRTCREDGYEARKSYVNGFLEGFALCKIRLRDVFYIVVLHGAQFRKEKECYGYAVVFTVWFLGFV
jgi:hypothetical protein